jgi:O-succinylbenzoic acid--CoA ligase
MTDDLGYFDEQGYLYIMGRKSQKIITGGVNVYPLEVTTAILATNLVNDVAVIGIPNADWGEAVTAIYVPKTPQLTLETLKIAIQDQLSPVKHPKYWIAVEDLPRNQQGKLNHQSLQKIAVQRLRSPAAMDLSSKNQGIAKPSGAAL